MSEINKLNTEEIKDKDNYLDKNNEFNIYKNDEKENINQLDLKNNEFTKKIGNYILFEQIGMGSFSKVTKGIHLITEQIVAVKILEKEKIEDDIDIERIIREIEILKTIMHPNIAQMYETYSTIHNIYLMMEYVEGGDLFDYITNNLYLPEQKACHIYRQIISVLEYLNKMGISHRDIKPENILLDKNHTNIKFIDFGLSNYCKNKELLHSSCGSPCYASPEMLSGQPYLGSTTDLWSSGVVLYSMLVGSLPFDDQEIQELYNQIKVGKFYLPSTLSLEAIDLLKRVLEVNPLKRITLKEIKAHPWFNFVQNPLYKGIIYKDDNDKKFPYNNKVISYVIKQYFKDDENINNDKLIEMIEKHESNQYTATYYITKKYILKIEDDIWEEKSDDKVLLKLAIRDNNRSNMNNKNLLEKSTLNEKDIKNILDKKNKRSNTEENMSIKTNNNQQKNKNSKTKILLFSNTNTNTNKDKNKLRENLSTIKNDIPKLDLKNSNFFSINDNENNNIINFNKPYTIRGISPPNDLKNIYDFNSIVKNNNYNNSLNIFKTDENMNGLKNLYKDNNNKNNIRKDILYLDNSKYYNKKNKNKETIPFLSKTDENIIIDKEKNSIKNKLNEPFIKDKEEELKRENNITGRKKTNNHRKKYLNIMPKLNISNLNISNNNKKKININFMNYINNKDNCENLNSNNNNSIFNNSKSRNNNSLNYYNKNMPSNKNYIFSYLNKDYTKNKEKIHQRNLSNIIINQLHNSKTTENKNNKILIATELGLLSKKKNNIKENNIVIFNNYKNRNLSRNNNNDEISRTKRLDLTKSLEKNHYIISPRSLIQNKNGNNKERKIIGVLNLKEKEQNKKWNINTNKIKNINNININQNGINLTNINNIGNNNKFINKYYLNNGNIINNNNNIILNIKNYYNRKNNKTYDYNNRNGIQNKYN